MGAGVRESLWLFPVIETVHLLGMAALVGTIGVFDLRLLGLAMKRARVGELGARLLPWAWLGFAVQVVTGAVLFASEAAKIYVNPAFRLKMMLILFAGVQAVIFQWMMRRDASEVGREWCVASGGKSGGRRFDFVVGGDCGGGTVYWIYIAVKCTSAVQSYD